MALGDVQFCGSSSSMCEAGVRSLDLFGSVARGEAAKGSDVDLLVQRQLGAILGACVDLIMRDAVDRQLRDRIFADAVRAFSSGFTP